jgi:hypothetical protein
MDRDLNECSIFSLKSLFLDGLREATEESSEVYKNYIELGPEMKRKQIARNKDFKLHFDLYIHPRRQIQVREVIDRLRVRIQDVDEPLVNPHLVLIACILVDERRPIDRHLMDLGRERDWASDFGTCSLCGFDDLPSRLVDDFVVIRLDLDTDSRRHFLFFLGSHDCE